MSKQRDIKISLFDILECSKNCIEFTKGMDLELFENDLKTSSAVLHQIMIIGEAVKRLGNEFTSSYHVLPWKEIAGTRDILIHHYEEADNFVVWNIVVKDLPSVIVEVEKILKGLEDGESY